MSQPAPPAHKSWEAKMGILIGQMMVAAGVVMGFIAWNDWFWEA